MTGDSATLGTEDEPVRSERLWYWSWVPQGHGEEPADVREAQDSCDQCTTASRCRVAWLSPGTVVFNCEHRRQNPPGYAALHAASANQDGRRRLVDGGHPGDRHRGPRQLATSSGHRRCVSPSAACAPPLVERTRSNDDRGHRRGSARPLKACYTAISLLTAALSGLPHQIRDSSPLLRFVQGIPLEPVIRFTRIPEMQE